ncbi:lysophospholipid acyltransferase family protein [Paraglaciecola sp.]|uniref:lysophospholipid acyltransferase family protein n=1 Tax=Paraglaciecola sp. TaxID=1920173 RepID=UPI0030F3B454
MKYAFINLLIRAVIVTLRLFSRVTRQRVAFFIARMILRCSPKTRNRGIKNIINAIPSLTASEAKNMLFDSYQTIAFGVSECFWLSDIKIDIVCDEHTLALLNNVKGVSVATMHMSCFEAAPVAVEKLTGSVTTLSKIPAFLKFAEQVYQQANISVINTAEPNAFIKLLEVSRNYAAVCLHSDHYAKNVEVEFFNKTTGAPSGAAMVSAYNKVPLLLCYAILQGNGRYKVTIETISEQPVANSRVEITAAMQNIYQRFEQIILQYPEQWYWSYNRWRD